MLYYHWLGRVFFFLIYYSRRSQLAIAFLVCMFQILLPPVLVIAFRVELFLEIFLFQSLVFFECMWELEESKLNNEKKIECLKNNYSKSKSRAYLHTVIRTFFLNFNSSPNYVTFNFFSVLRLYIYVISQLYFQVF